jgi:hypothetical protein
MIDLWRRLLRRWVTGPEGRHQEQPPEPVKAAPDPASALPESWARTDVTSLDLPPITPRPYVRDLGDEVRAAVRRFYRPLEAAAAAAWRFA